MTTSAPVVHEFDIPIVEPYHLPDTPKRLPQPAPERIATPIVVPTVVPVRQPVEVGYV